MREISIAIPTYEMKGFGSFYIKELFESIKNQTFKNFEVCVSDHSKDDDILEVCSHYANYFPIQYFKNEEKRGNGSFNTNSAVEMCEGRITKLIFQDDLLINNNALSIIKKTFDEKNCDWIFNSFKHTTDGKKHFRPMVPKWTREMLEGRNLLGNPSSVAFLTDKFEKFDENLILLMDTDFYHRMRYNHGMPFIIKEYLTSVREHNSRMSSSTVKYNAQVEHPEGSWLVNSEELDYVIKKHSKTRNYPDEN
jgi:glycosyltransferase involved in cell wall biosynthesis